MLSFWLCFLSFFYTVNVFSTEEEKVKKKCGICLEEFEENDSSTLIKSKKIFSCTCDKNNLICKKCILKHIVATINSKKEKELTENDEKIGILEVIFSYIKEKIEDKYNNDLQNFVKKIVEKKEQIGENQELNAEEKLIYSNINEKKDELENTKFYIGNEQDPTEKLKFIKSFLSLLKQFNGGSYSFLTHNIEMSISYNCQKEIKIEEIEKWEEKDFKIEVSCELDTTELQKKIKNEKVIRITCPFCKKEIEKGSDFFLKICEEPSSQESSKKLSCLEYCGNICSDCC